MIIIKSWYHFIAFIQGIFFAIVYGPKLKIGRNTTWRRGFSIMMDSTAHIYIGDNFF